MLHDTVITPPMYIMVACCSPRGCASSSRPEGHWPSSKCLQPSLSMGTALGVYSVGSIPWVDESSAVFPLGNVGPFSYGGGGGEKQGHGVAAFFTAGFPPLARPTPYLTYKKHLLEAILFLAQAYQLFYHSNANSCIKNDNNLTLRRSLKNAKEQGDHSRESTPELMYRKKVPKVPPPPLPIALVGAVQSLV